MDYLASQSQTKVTDQILLLTAYLNSWKKERKDRTNFLYPERHQWPQRVLC